jgi:hypothetical protein
VSGELSGPLGRVVGSRRLIVAGALLLICLLPLLKGTMLLTAPFGDSHDGRNGAVWAAGSEALRGDPIGSRLGAERLDGTTYANHPPGILAVVATAELVGGDRPAAARGAMLVALWSAIVLLYLLLRAVGLPTWTALVGCAALAVTPMVRSYGSMVDTPMLALPLFVAVLLVVVSAADRDRLAGWQLAVLVAGPLVSWQLVLLEGLVLVGMALDRHRRRHLPGAGAAVAVGTALTFSWLLWAHGSFGPMVDVFVRRSGMEEGNVYGPRAAIDLQWWAAKTFLGPLIWFVPACIVWAVLHPTNRRRWVGGLAVIGVLAYMLAMSHGAAIHDYWNYWLVVAAALGAAGAVEWLYHVLRSTSFGPAVRVTATVLSVAVVLGATYSRTAIHEIVNVSSAFAGAALDRADLPAGQDALWLLAEFKTDDSWVTEGARPPTAHLTEAAYDRAVADGRGHEIVLVSSSCNASVLACDRIPGLAGPYEHRTFSLLRIDDLGPRHDRTSDAPDASR